MAQNASVYLDFKTKRIQDEWEDGWTNSDGKHDILHPALRVITLAAALEYFRRFGKKAVVTHIFRTREEQRKIYPDEPTRRSVHEYGRGVDLRTREISPQDVKLWENWIKYSFKYNGSLGISTALFHSVIGGHMHLQVGPLEEIP